MKSNRIFLGCQEISGMMERLNNAFHELGIKSDFYCMDKYGFATEEMEKETLPILKKFRIHTDKRMESVGTKWENWWYFLQMWDILHIFFYVLFRYDKFIYIFGHGMFFYNKYLSKIEELEFLILKIFNKKMIMWLCGSDSRAPYCDVMIHLYSERDDRIDKIYRVTQRRRKRIKMLEKYMLLIDYPASAHFHTKSYILFNSIGMPVDEKEAVKNAKKKNNKVTILHAPSFQKGKGTEVVRNIIDDIRKEGNDFEYIEVSGMPHNIVLEKLASADIVIDQVYSDAPMAGFATEAALNGVPVIVGGYYAKEYAKILNKPLPPTVFCEPEEMKEKLLELLNSPELREKIGQEEIKYVRDNNVATTIAGKFIKLFEGIYPKEWLFEPDDNQYIWGAGVSKELVINCIVQLLDKYGTNALCLKEDSILFKNYINLYEEYKHLKK